MNDETSQSRHYWLREGCTYACAAYASNPDCEFVGAYSNVDGEAERFAQQYHAKGFSFLDEVLMQSAFVHLTRAMPNWPSYVRSTALTLQLKSRWLFP